MQITLSFEKTVSSDISIMVDVLRASTTITLGLNNFNEIIPCFSPEQAFKLKNKYGGIIAGERGGAKVEGFDMGNSPTEIRNFKGNTKTLILTTSNGVRILEAMNSNVLIGCLANANSVAQKSLELAETHIDVVMAGINRDFAIEDYLAGGVIIHQISKLYDGCEISEYAKSAVLASRDYKQFKKAFQESSSGKILTGLGYEKDIDLCLKMNTSNNVGFYKNNKIINIL